MHLHPIILKDCTVPVNVFIAPLAGYTNLPTRMFFRSQGAGIAYAEMVSAMGIHYNSEKTSRLLVSMDEDRPLGIQMFGPDPDHIESAFSKIAELPFDLIDLNCGCPVRKVIKGKGGAWLLQDPENIYNIIRRLVKMTEMPVTIKIRSGFDADHINYTDVLDAAVQGGAHSITFHPRTRSQFFNGKADWSLIRHMKEISSIPVIGNGDIFSGGDAVAMMEQTGCDGVMLARGVIENPFLVEEVVAALDGKTYTPPGLERRLDALCGHLKALADYYGETRGVLEFRKYFRGYLKGFPDVSRLRSEINRIDNVKQAVTTIHEWASVIKRHSQ